LNKTPSSQDPFKKKKGEDKRVLIERALEYIEENDILEVFAYNIAKKTNIIQDFASIKDNYKIFDAIQSKLEESSD
jgi:hypothetical protein